MIRTLSLSLVLCFVTAQAVSLADCCCGSFCQHKNSCTGCRPEDACPGGERTTEKPSCCGTEESAPKKTCSHLEPSSEIDTVSADAGHPPPPMPALVAPIEQVPPPLADIPPSAMETGPPRSGPGHSIPLHLYLSVLRI